MQRLPCRPCRGHEHRGTLRLPGLLGGPHAGLQPSRQRWKTLEVRWGPLKGLHTHLWACSIRARAFWSFSHSSLGAGPTGDLLRCFHAARPSQSGGLCGSSGRRSRDEDNATWCVTGSVEGKQGTCPFGCRASPEALHIVTAQSFVVTCHLQPGLPRAPTSQGVERLHRTLSSSPWPASVQ